MALPPWTWAAGAAATAAAWFLYMKPSPHFTWGELTTTSQDEPNEPTLTQRIMLLLLAWWVLEPLRAAFGAIRVTSAYRSPAVNKGAKGATDSHHMQGTAADIYAIAGYTHEAMAQFIYEHSEIPVRQVIVERHTGHLHVELDTAGPPGKRQFLQTSDGSTYTTWSPA